MTTINCDIFIITLFIEKNYLIEYGVLNTDRYIFYDNRYYGAYT